MVQILTVPHSGPPVSYKITVPPREEGGEDSCRNSFINQSSSEADATHKKTWGRTVIMVLLLELVF